MPLKDWSNGRIERVFDNMFRFLNELLLNTDHFELTSDKAKSNIKKTSASINSLVVKCCLASAVTWVRFPVDAFFICKYRFYSPPSWNKNCYCS